jgi:WD40 repeat protein
MPTSGAREHSESEYAPLATADDASENLPPEPAGLPLEQKGDDARSSAAALVAQKNEEISQFVALRRETNEQMQKMRQEIEDLKTPRPSAVGVRPNSSGEGFISPKEHDAALKEVAKLRQLVNSAKAVGGEENILRVLSGAESSLFAVDHAEAQSSGPPLAPAGRTLRQTAQTKMLKGGLYFTPDAQTLVHAGSLDTKLSMWDLQTGICTVAVERSGGICSSALSPDGTLLCIAAVDGLAMFRFRGSGGGKLPSCELLWDIASGTAFVDVTFSRDGKVLASARGLTGVVEIHDAMSEGVPKLLDGFPACRGKDQPHGLSFSPELLAVGGRKHKPNEKQVRLYTIASDFKEHTTLDLPSLFFKLCFNHAGTKLAVGMKEPANLFIYSSENDWDEPVRLGTVQPGDTATSSLAFSRDDRLLCVGYFPSDTFALWDLEERVCVRTFAHANSFAFACAFSPADDLLALGSNDVPITLHELRPSEPLHTFKIPGEQEEPLSAACASAELVVLASSKRLVAIRRSDKKVIWQTDTAAEVKAIHDPMALQPTGQQVAVCMEKLEAVSVRDVQTGKELHLLKGGFHGWFAGVFYSADGALISVCGDFRTAVYDAANGKLKYSFVGKDDQPNIRVHTVWTDPASKVLLTTSWPGASFVRDVGSGKVLHTLEDIPLNLAGCFDDAGERMAYALVGQTATGGVDTSKDGQLLICDATNGYRVLKRIALPTMGCCVHTQFSPGDGAFMLLATYNPAPQTIILDVETGEQPAWSKCLRAMMLPPGDIPFHTICWMSHPPPAEADRDSPAPPLVLQAAVGMELHMIDVSAFIRSFEEDGNFSLEQLNRLSDNSRDAIPALLEKWPYIINYRDDVTGDTVLHHCARSGNPTATELWLTGTVPYTPVENADGRSALLEAIDKQQLKAARLLVQLLDRGLDLERTRSLTNDLMAIADKWPRQIVDFVELLEEDSEHFSLFRRIKSFDVLNAHLENFDVRASADGRGTALWDQSHNVQYEGGDKEVKCDATLQVLALTGFAAAPTKDKSGQLVLPPYTQFFEAVSGNDERLSALLKTRLMQSATKFKWDSYVQARVLRRLCLYLLHFALAAAALLLSTQTTDQNVEFHSNGGWGGEWSSVTPAMTADVLQLCLLVTNSIVLYREMRQLHLTPSTKEYLTDAWNLCDLGGIAALYIACGAHFAQSAFVLTQVGSFGVLLNSFSVLQLLTPFEWTGPLIKTVIEIMVDIRGYLIIIVILLLGFSVSFAVSMPDNEAFYANGMAGPLVGLLTTFRATLGSFLMTDYETTVSTVSFLFFLFLNVVVMLNLLIAIMSDSYERVKDGEVVEALKLRAETIIKEEALMSKADWANERYFPAYLEVLQAKEPPELKWSGVSGQISNMDSKVSGKVDDVKEEVNRKVSEVEVKVGQVQAEMSQMSAKVDKVADALTAKVDALQKHHEAMDAKLEAILKAVTAAAPGQLEPERKPGLGPGPGPEPEPEPEPAQ